MIALMKSMKRMFREVNRDGTFQYRRIDGYRSVPLYQRRGNRLRGTGLPLMATMLAQKTHAPHLCFVAETGPIAPIVCRRPVGFWTRGYSIGRCAWARSGSPRLPAAAGHDGCRLCGRRRDR